jgi:hypothetical protein
MMTLRIISYGGGVQSTAMLVLAAQRNRAFTEACGGPIDAAVHGNVGDDSEHPSTVDYLARVAVPFADRHGLRLVEVRRTIHGQPAPTLLEESVDPGVASICIPIRMDNGAPGRRSCTRKYKIEPISQWLRANGATAADPATVAIGISTDEIERIGRRNHTIKTETQVYPLIGLGMSRADCRDVIAGAGLPVPHKSACWFCPFTRRAEWREMRRDEPELFARSVELERTHNVKRDAIGQPGGGWLSGYGRPLDEAITEAEPTLPGIDGNLGEDGCDEGYCFT